MDQLAANLKERLALKDALACETEIRSGDEAFEAEADLVFKVAREYLDLLEALGGRSIVESDGEQ
jgi:hypothetical protein